MRFLVIFLSAIFLSSCDTSICSNKLIEDSVSPGDEYIASIFERNCGATTPYIRVVSLRPSKSKFEPNDDDTWVFTIHGRTDIKVSWITDNELRVDYKPTGDQPTQREKWKQVLISYE